MADQYFGDLAELTVDGNAITIGSSSRVSRVWKKTTAPATWANPEVTKPVSYLDTIVIPFSDLDDHAEFLVLWNLAAAKTAVPCVLYPEGNTAGKQIWSGNAYVEVDGIDVGIEKAAGGTITLNFSGGMTPTPNIVLATQAVGTVAAGGAGSGLTTLVASGGTTTYTYTLQTQLPRGLTMTSGGVFGGTNDASQIAGTYTFTVRVTDSAATPVVKDFVCTVISS